MAQLSLSLFGRPQATLDGVAVAGFESQKVRALLVYLALEATRPHAREALAGLLWPEQPDHDARNNLRQALANLRQALGDQRAAAPFLLIAGATIQFNCASDQQIDVAAFTNLLDACEQHPHRHPESCTACARRLHAAAELYHGDFLDQFFLSDSAAFEEWALLVRERLHRRAIAALAQLADYHERRGENALAERYTRRQLELEPWREEGHRQLMRLLARSGERSAALVQYATCRRALAEELGVEPETETTELYERIKRGEALTDARPGLSTSNLAAHTPPTPLIGREAELAQLAERLEERDCRLLTLVGPGGIGKTRLGLQAAAELGASFRDGVCFVALAPLGSAEFVVPTIAGALGLTFTGPADPKAQLLAFLRAKDLLLLLDNFEHLLSAAPLVSELLATCADVTVLATSRAPLHVRGEHQFPVPPLRLPNLAQLPEVGTLTQYSAVALFVARAEAVQPSFHLTSAAAPAVATICARLDGLPLAIELAAMRVKLLPPEGLLARLEQRLALLTNGARDLPPRQQTLRAAIGWSYELLDAGEQTLFGRLSVFVGGCTLAAAEGVCNASGDLPLDVLDGLATLVDTSLLRQEADEDGEPRFVMLETIREYARLQLAECGERARIEHNHAAYFLQQAEDLQDEAAWLDRMEADHDNLRAALHWALAHDAAIVGLRLCITLQPFWENRGYWSEGRRWTEELVAASDDAAPQLRMQALCCIGEFAWKQGDYTTATARMTESLALSRALDDRSATGHRLMILGVIALHQGSYDQATALLTESLQVRRSIGEAPTGSLLHLGELALAQEEYAQAQRWLEESLMICREENHTFYIVRLLSLLGEVALGQGDVTRARALLQESVAVSRDVRHPRVMTFALAGLAGAVAGGPAPSAEDVQRAARIWGAAEALREQVGIFLPVADRMRYEQATTRARARLNPEVWAKAWAQGRLMPLEQAIVYALDTDGPVN